MATSSTQQPCHLAGPIDGAPAQEGSAAWVECRDCGLLQPMASRERARICRRCRAALGHGRAALKLGLPLAITAALLFVLAQSYPLLGIELEGLARSVDIASGVAGLVDRHLSPLALLVLVASIAAPVLRVAGDIYVLASIELGSRPRHLRILYRLTERLRPWAMLDVLLLGTLIAVTKLHDLAAVDIGIGLWALGLQILTLAAFDTAIDRRRVWSTLAPEPTVKPEPSTSIGCRVCGLVSATAVDDEIPRCTRCGARLLPRKRDSINRTWALVITGLLLYIPANLYPALTVISFGRGEPSTIVDGVVELMNGTDWPLALLIFTASIAVPLLKLSGLMTLLISVQLGSAHHLLGRTRLYRAIEFIGRWSMIDVFVAALLTALVTLGRVATIEPGLGILAFGAVVVTTMLATESFDPRLIWDRGRMAHE